MFGLATAVLLPSKHVRPQPGYGTITNRLAEVMRWTWCVISGVDRQKMRSPGQLDGSAARYRNRTKDGTRRAGKRERNLLLTFGA